TDPKATARRCRTAGAEGDGSAAPRPKTATVERREASVPRHKRVHARLDALWDARRLASAWHAASWRAPRVFRRAPERLSALRPPLFPGERSKGANPGRKKRAAGTRRCCSMPGLSVGQNSRDMSQTKKRTRAEEALAAAEQRRLAPVLREAHA